MRDLPDRSFGGDDITKKLDFAYLSARRLGTYLEIANNEIGWLRGICELLATDHAAGLEEWQEYLDMHQPTFYEEGGSDASPLA